MPPNCINWRFPGSGRIYRWQFEKRGKKLEVAVEGPLISNHQDVVIEGALQGLGILYAYDDDRVDEAVARGRLKRVLADWSLTSPGLYLYYTKRRHSQPALRAFIDCLLDREQVKKEVEVPFAQVKRVAAQGPAAPARSRNRAMR